MTVTITVEGIYDCHHKCGREYMGVTITVGGYMTVTITVGGDI